MQATQRSIPSVPLRSPATVMRLARLGSFHQCRLSFMRTLLRRMKREGWRFERPVFDIDDKGVGVAVYAAWGPERTYSLVCFGHDLPPELRSDRVIAHAWDSTFALFDGVPSPDDIERLSWNIPKQEAGRVTNREICISRANRSVRLFTHVVDSLAAGHQPDLEKIEAVGYLMRTTAVYGSGKFGATDREALADRPEFVGPFQAEMLSVYLTRAYTLDLVEHMARARSPETAVAIDPSLRRRFGVGNSTGLGLAPFIVNHPVLFNNWIAARETALARVRALPSASDGEKARFRAMVTRARRNAEEWRSEHAVQMRKLVMLKADLAHLEEHVGAGALEQRAPWDGLTTWAERSLSMEGQEQLISLMLEPYGDLVDELADRMGADEGAAFRIDGAMSLDCLREIIENVYDFALKLDWASPDTNARVWYVGGEAGAASRRAFRGADRALRAAAGARTRCCPDARRYARLGGREQRCRVPAASSRAPAFCAPGPDHRAAALCRNSRQYDLRGAAADRPPALQTFVFRCDPLRPALGPLGAYQHVPRRALPARAGR